MTNLTPYRYLKFYILKNQFNYISAKGMNCIINFFLVHKNYKLFTFTSESILKEQNTNLFL